MHAISAMSEEQFFSLIAQLKEDTELQEKLKGASDLDAAVAIAKEAGFDVSKADWLKHQTMDTLELGDEELEEVSGGGQVPCLQVGGRWFSCGMGKGSA
jgi:predicted ribosomally synthesized peptide with nif11-like leader